MSRPQLLKSYKDQMATYISRKYGLPIEKAAELSLQMCEENYKPLTAVVVETKEDGIDAVKEAEKDCKEKIDIASLEGEAYENAKKVVEELLKDAVDGRTIEIE